MARRSKSSRGTGPNKVLVVFLVLFILTSIGLGVWAYTLVKERDNWPAEAKKKDEEIQKAKLMEAWANFKADELRAAMGDKSFYDQSENVNFWLQTRAYFKDGTRFYSVPDREAFLATMTSLEEKLGGVSPSGYKTRLFDVALKPDQIAAFNEYEKQVPKLPREMAEKKELIEKVNSLEKLVNKYRDAQAAMITAGNAKAFDILKDKFKAFDDADKANKDLREQMEKMDAEFRKEMGKKSQEIGALMTKIKEQEAKDKNPNRALLDPHALVMDVSRGRTLWDTPRGKIIRIDEGAKKVYINKGSKDGVKVGLTFLVFSGWQNRGVGPLKATIEVVRVEDDHTSQCKVNSYYDIDGHEIAANEATPSKVLRDGNGALKDGDLLFNLMWGMHVAIVGIVDFTGYGANTPAAQKESLDEFMLHLNRMGVTVDAYMDPRDGKIVGSLTPQTNFVIRGSTAGAAAPDSKDERKDAILASLKYMREQAIDRGMIIISDTNFAVVTGYRRPGSANNQQVLSFTPRPPAGGAGLVGDTQQLQESQDNAKKQ
jgi:hypothetical protein